MGKRSKEEKLEAAVAVPVEQVNNLWEDSRQTPQVCSFVNASAFAYSVAAPALGMMGEKAKLSMRSIPSCAGQQIAVGGKCCGWF